MITKNYEICLYLLVTGPGLPDVALGIGLPDVPTFCLLGVLVPTSFFLNLMAFLHWHDSSCNWNYNKLS